MMAPRTRTTIYATPTHNRNRKVQVSNIPRTTTKLRTVDKDFDHKDTVGVYLRIRPLKSDEPTLVKINDRQVKAISPDRSGAQVYSFTKVFDDAPQSEVFDKVARPVAEDFVKNAKDGLIFTYGITGSGKTYTMEGLRTDPGLIYRTIDFLFNSIGAQQTQKYVIENDGHNCYHTQEQEQLYPNLAQPETLGTIPSVVKWQNRQKESAFVSVEPTEYYCLFISLIELYNKQVYDLFEDFDAGSVEKDKKRREIRTDHKGMSYVANAVEIEVKSADEAVELYTRGVRRRKTGSTALNQESSRGHCVLNLKLARIQKSYDGRFDEDSLKSSQLCLVDLAGSERAKRSGATGGALHEACNINNSLGALRKCIRALRDREPTSNIQYREYSLTRLFKSYFEGHGSVCMVLCVKPTPEDFQENNIAMEFGLLTQDVPVDYASPAKILKRTKSRGQEITDYAMMYEYFDRKLSHYEPNPDLSDEQYIESWLERLRNNRNRRKKYVETAIGAQTEVRQNILATVNENRSLRELYETRVKEVKGREEQIEILESDRNDKIKTLERVVRKLESDNHEKERKLRELHATKKLVQELTQQQSRYEKWAQNVVNLMESEEHRNERWKRVRQLLSTAPSTEPSAPEMEPLQSSSPVNIPNPSTTETNDSRTPPTTTNSSSEAMEYPERTSGPHSKTPLSSPTNAGIPVVNPRHNRSLSCSSMQWIHHRPPNTIKNGTVFEFKSKNGRSVKNLRSSDILKKNAAGYSVVHQDADPNGDVETSVYKGHIINTVCGGAQVILDDVETMRQASPKRKRTISDAAYTH